MGAWLQDSRIEDIGGTNSCPSIDYGEGFATGFMAPTIDVNIDSVIARVPPKSGLLVTQESVETKWDRSLERLNCYKMKNEQSKDLILQNCAAIEAISSCFKNAMKKELHSKQRKGLRKNLTQNYLCLHKSKQLRLPRWETVSIDLSL